MRYKLTRDHIELWVTDLNSHIKVVRHAKIDDVCFLLMKLKFSSPMYVTCDMKGRKLQAFGKQLFRKIFQSERLPKNIMKVFFFYS
jgi:hypothetical protein